MRQSLDILSIPFFIEKYGKSRTVVLDLKHQPYFCLVINYVHHTEPSLHFHWLRNVVDFNAPKNQYTTFSCPVTNITMNGTDILVKFCKRNM